MQVETDKMVTRRFQPEDGANVSIAAHDNQAEKENEMKVPNR